MPEGYYLHREKTNPVLREERLARIEEIENQIFENAAGVVEAVLAFHEVEPQQATPPPAWIEEFGLEGARQRLAVAKAGWMPQSVAPAAFKYAAQVMTGISRGRKMQMRIQNANLNVKLTLPAPTSAEHPGPVEYEIRDLDP